jgi:hypothetical protein
MDSKCMYKTHDRPDTTSQGRRAAAISALLRVDAQATAAGGPTWPSSIHRSTRGSTPREYPRESTEERARSTAKLHGGLAGEYMFA